MNVKTACRLLVLISGNGTNLQAIMDNCSNNTIPAEIVGVISNDPEAHGLVRARKAGVRNFVLNHKDYPNRKDYDLAILALARKYQTDLIVLAGFMRVLGENLISPFKGRILNIHPSLLPNYPGMNTHKRVLEDNALEHGVTVHFVTKDLDAGPIIIQKKFMVSDKDNESTLKSKVQKIEHYLYPKVVKWYASGRLKMNNGAALLDNKPINT